ncbi:MAG: hypothetical protein DRJ51_05115 [Thermoprotei archaeon]|nr:MAG: hypothetical protein DRJ51_05115 [Thermoprotei archaeon]RLF02178.1 MAG: hypothetical protein DRJ59_04285 [Thermoprotei archaeon]
MRRTFFLYVEENSPLYRLHPLLKILLLLFFNLEAWIIESPTVLWLSIVGVLVLFKLAKIPLARLLKFLLFAAIITQAIMFSYILGSKIPGNVVYYEFPWGTYVTDRTLLYAFSMVGRFMLMLVGSTLVLAVTRDIDIIYGIISLKIPYALAFTVSLAFRFATIFIDDYFKVRDAMILRGTALDKGGILERARKYVNLSIPLMVLAVRRMLELTYVLEAKGLNLKGKRSYFYEFKLGSLGIALALTLITIPILTLFLKMSYGLFTFPGWPFNG